MVNTNFIQYLVSTGVAIALTDMGLTSGEISQTQAIKRYGTWFVQKVKEGKLKPVRQGTGKSATKYFNISDILAQRAYDAQDINLKTI